jgi:hypothetical protein
MVNKLQIFWKSRKTWIYAFIEWRGLMYPHIKYGENWIYNEIDEYHNAYWFWESLNNYNNIFDEWL